MFELLCELESRGGGGRTFRVNTKLVCGLDCLHDA